MKAKIRKIVTVVEETLSEAGRDVSPPTRRAAAIAVIANAVDLPGHAAIERRPAEHIQPGNDLGAIPVTVAVGDLTEAEKAQALENGCRTAELCLARNLIRAAALHLGGQTRQVACVPQIRAA